MNAPANAKTICYRITRRCNWHCAFCQAPPRGSELETSEHFRVLQRLAQLGVSSIKLTGGEPLVRRDLEEVVAFADTLNMAVTVCTNGSLLRESLLELMERVRGRLKISVHSLRGTRGWLMPEEHAMAATAGLLRAAERGIRTAVHCVVADENWEELDEILSFACASAVEKVTLIPLVERGRFAGRGTRKMSWQTVEARALTLQREYVGKMEVRFLDLYRKPYYVVETDGVLYVQREQEGSDTVLIDLMSREDMRARSAGDLPRGQAERHE